MFRSLLAQYGPQSWWPAETPFEVMVGAVLVQNTSWRQAERAISALRAQGLLIAAAIHASNTDLLEDLVRPSGTYRLKAQRLKALAGFVVDNGGVSQLEKHSTETLRCRLLSIAGVGPETADAILLYAFERRVFVADAYARRVLQRTHALRLDTAPRYYERYRAQVESCCFDSRQLNEFHALLVEHGKRYCRASPRCEVCFAVSDCRFTDNPDSIPSASGRGHSEDRGKERG